MLGLVDAERSQPLFQMNRIAKAGIRRHGQAHLGRPVGQGLEAPEVMLHAPARPLGKLFGKDRMVGTVDAVGAKAGVDGFHLSVKRRECREIAIGALPEIAFRHGHYRFQRLAVERQPACHRRAVPPFAQQFRHDVARVERLFLHEAFIPGTYRGDYVRERYHDVDPRTIAARQGSLPLVWDLQQLHAQPPADHRNDAAQAGLDGFIKMMRDDGMRSGLMFAMSIPGTRMHAFMSFTAQRRTRDWITSTTLEQALTIGMSVHTIASQQLTAAARERTADGLTEFERELLLGIAEGASDKEIGRRLDTSPHNVDYHLRKLRKRFGVANRTELTYLTSKLELI